MMKKLFIFTFLIGLCLFSLQDSNAATINVHPGGSIQSAVNHAANGDTIVVYANNKQPYTYKESIVINKKINIKSSGKVTIQPKNTGSSAFTLNQKGSGSTIQNFIISKSSYAILVNGAKYARISGNTISGVSLVGIQFNGDVTNTKVISNRITGLSKNNGNGISFQYGDCNYISSYNSISGNIISNFLTGIIFNAKSEHNTIYKNKISVGSKGVGIYATDNSKYIHIISNTVSGGQDGIAVQKMGSGIATHYDIIGNIVKNNVNGFWMILSYSKFTSNIATLNKVSGFDITGSHNIIIKNTATKNGVCGICLGKYSSQDYNIVKNNILTYNTAGINSASAYTTISNNIVRYNTHQGIISTANHTTITGNKFSNNPTRILTTGTSNNIKY